MGHAPDLDFIALQRALAGEYSIDREIGRGGMGIVYLAREVSLARPVAIKVLPPGSATPELREAFLREAQIVARLSHPNIVPVYAVGQREGYAYIVMAFVEGITLGERIRARGAMLPGQAARVLREVAWALAYAHAGGIVHRDISADNIVLERGTDRAVVMDFGIASASLATAVNSEGRVMGNPYFLSPEQASGEPVDNRSDLYSLGVCGFYALTGRLPFTGDTPTEIVARHISESPAPITVLAPAVPARLARAVDKCLAKEPWRRYRSAEEFADAIDQAFEHAREIPAPLRLWIRKEEAERGTRAVAIASGAILGGILVLARLAPPWFFYAPVAATLTLSLLPNIARLRRVIGDGYAPDDLSAALREHQLVREEEMAYERAQTSPRGRQFLWGLLATSVAGGIAFGQALARIDRWSSIGTSVPGYLGAGILVSLSLGAISVVRILGDAVRNKFSSRVAAGWISFWKGPAGHAWTRIATVGVKKPTHAALGMPMRTEVALGRATDHLFHALARPLRRQLGALPDVVRRLEREASTSRVRIDEIDAQVMAFEVTNASAAMTSYREALREDLMARRADFAARLAATVAALENIRLDLLRLQMGDGGVESITASLEAAKRVGEDIAAQIDARAQVDALLREPAPAQEEANLEDDDSDTPVGGVTAASV